METETTGVKPNIPQSAEHFIKQVRRKTRKRFSSEEKIRIVLEGMKREIPVTELCRRESIPAAIYYSWTKSFMEAGKNRLKGDSLRGAGHNEVQKLKKENEKLKAILGEYVFANQLLKKNLTD